MSSRSIRVSRRGLPPRRSTRSQSVFRGKTFRRVRWVSTWRWWTSIPASGVFYYPVDLDHPHLLAADGLSAGESNPAVPPADGLCRRHDDDPALRARARPRRRCGRNTRVKRRTVMYYDDSSCAGSASTRTRFVTATPTTRPRRRRCCSATSRSRPRTTSNTPGTVVFTCLSHDIVAHETTHALLDGVHPRFNEPTNPDVHAFHEAFADIVALFQHFTYPPVLESQIRRTRGDLDSESLLGQLAQQFGRATGRGRGAARRARRPRRGDRRMEAAHAGPARARFDARRARPRRHSCGGGLPRLPPDLPRSHRRPLSDRDSRHRQAAGGGNRPGPHGTTGPGCSSNQNSATR